MDWAADSEECNHQKNLLGDSAEESHYQNDSECDAVHELYVDPAEEGHHQRGWLVDPVAKSQSQEVETAVLEAVQRGRCAVVIQTLLMAQGEFSDSHGFTHSHHNMPFEPFCSSKPPQAGTPRGVSV